MKKSQSEPPQGQVKDGQPYDWSPPKMPENEIWQLLHNKSCGWSVFHRSETDQCKLSIRLFNDENGDAQKTDIDIDRDEDGQYTLQEDGELKYRNLQSMANDLQNRPIQIISLIGTEVTFEILSKRPTSQSQLASELAVPHGTFTAPKLMLAQSPPPPKMSRPEAEQYLMGKEQGTFLLRESCIKEQPELVQSAILRDGSPCVHHRIKHLKNGKLKIDGSKLMYDCVDQLRCRLDNSLFSVYIVPRVNADLPTVYSYTYKLWTRDVSSDAADQWPDKYYVMTKNGIEDGELIYEEGDMIEMLQVVGDQCKVAFVTEDKEMWVPLQDTSKFCYEPYYGGRYAEDTMKGILGDTDDGKLDVKEGTFTFCQGPRLLSFYLYVRFAEIIRKYPIFYAFREDVQAYRFCMAPDEATEKMPMDKWLAFKSPKEMIDVIRFVFKVLGDKRTVTLQEPVSKFKLIETISGMQGQKPNA